MIPIAMAVVLAFLQANVGAPAEQSPRQDYVRPAGKDSYYPPAARRAGKTGHVILACSVTGGGRLTECVVAEESPPGWGFGEAALRMAPLFKMRPITKSGRSVAGAHIRIPINFNP